MDKDYLDFVRRMLAGNKAEASEWLAGSSPGSFRNLGEMGTTEESSAFVRGLYDLGAAQVIACEIEDYGDGQNSGNLLVRLPDDPDARERLFAFERDHAEAQGFDGTPDEGQEYLYLKLD